MSDFLKRFKQLSGLVESRPQYMVESEADRLFREMDEQAYSGDITLEALERFSQRVEAYVLAQGITPAMLESTSGKKLKTKDVDLHGPGHGEHADIFAGTEPKSDDEGEDGGDSEGDGEGGIQHGPNLGQKKITVHDSPGKLKGVPFVASSQKHTPKKPVNISAHKAFRTKKSNADKESPLGAGKAHKEVAAARKKVALLRHPLRAYRRGEDEAGSNPPEGFEREPGDNVPPPIIKKTFKRDSTGKLVKVDGKPVPIEVPHPTDTRAGYTVSGKDKRHHEMSQQHGAMAMHHLKLSNMLATLVKHPPEGATPEQVARWDKHSTKHRQLSARHAQRVAYTSHTQHNHEGPGGIETSFHPDVGHNPANPEGENKKYMTPAEQKAEFQANRKAAAKRVEKRKADAAAKAAVTDKKSDTEQ